MKPELNLMFAIVLLSMMGADALESFHLRRVPNRTEVQEFIRITIILFDPVFAYFAANNIVSAVRKMKKP